MKYAHEVMDLLASYPGRDFRMEQVVRYVAGPSLDQRKRRAVREAVRVVLGQLAESGCVIVTPSTRRGSFALYRWREAEAVQALRAA